MPRVVIAGLAGDAGKTLLSLGLIKTWRRNGLFVTPFKKGPDFIDAAWLSLAANNDAYNLDTFLMGPNGVLDSFQTHAGEISLIEGNRGLFDGFDSMGTHSTAELAKLLKSPVVIVFNAAKVTRTAAAFIRGCQQLDPDLQISGVIPNQIAGERHFNIIKESIERECGIPVLGMIPKIRKRGILPERHLGLVTPSEFSRREESIIEIAEIVENNVNTDAILEIARKVPSLQKVEKVNYVTEKSVNVGYFRDSAFTFYYPDNLAALKASGANLIPVSSMENSSLPDNIHGLYIGGGFPETHLSKISENTSLMHEIKVAAENGLPIYAECGGLIYLSKEFKFQGNNYQFCDVLPLSIGLRERPAGHGYMLLTTDKENPFFPISYRFRAHEFHYSFIEQIHKPELKTIFRVERGVGSLKNRDGILYKNVLASYAHVHSVGNSEWAKGFVRLCHNFKKKIYSKPEAA